MAYYNNRFRLGNTRRFGAPPVPVSPQSLAASPPAAPGSGVSRLGPLPRSYAVFDFETTGLSPRSDEITEVGWLVVRDGVASEPRSALCAISGSIPPEVVTLTGITNHMVRTQGLSLDRVLTLLYDDADGLPLVGHNCARFDVPFLEHSSFRIGRPPPARGRYIDTAAIYKGDRSGLPHREVRAASHFDYAQLVLGRPSRLKYNLAVCCAAYGLGRDDVVAHRAAGDVLLTHRLYEAIVRQDDAAEPARAQTYLL